ncbi:MAG: CocE/NonD family hydrolase [Bryobacteraceae bacterium]
MIRGAVLLVALVAAAPAAETDSFAVETVMMPLRDGVRLATDIYRPARGGTAADGKFPVLLTRSPYNKRGERSKGEFFARQGYVFVAQDCRGFHASEGEMYPLLNEARDGYDAIEWAARQPWSNGKVATTGASYLAMNQYAASNPPARGPAASPRTTRFITTARGSIFRHAKSP